MQGSCISALTVALGWSARTAASVLQLWRYLFSVLTLTLTLHDLGFPETAPALQQ